MRIGTLLTIAVAVSLAGCQTSPKSDAKAPSDGTAKYGTRMTGEEITRTLPMSRATGTDGQWVVDNGPLGQATYTGSNGQPAPASWRVQGDEQCMSIRSINNGQEECWALYQSGTVYHTVHKDGRVDTWKLTPLR